MCAKKYNLHGFKQGISSSHEVRIIGGFLKRTKLSVLKEKEAPSGFRPTLSRVRETLFNWLGQDLSGWYCVDMFAGTGALGLEAVSRGAAQVYLYEAHKMAFFRIKCLIDKLLQGHSLENQAITPIQGDAMQLIHRLPDASLDLVFIDPPFDGNLHSQALETIKTKVKKQGFVYLEDGKAWQDDHLKMLGFYIMKQSQAGNVHFYLLGLL